MISRLLLAVTLVFGLTVPLLWETSGVSAALACDPAYVTQTHNRIVVKSTGVDDTSNLQCALDAAVDFGAGAKVQLQAGTFRTRQIVVNGFAGQFTGSGLNSTTIVNLPELYVTPVDFYLNPPSAQNPWSALFAFTDGDFSISDLAIRVVGQEPTTGWTVFGIDPPLKELSSAIVIIGAETHAEISHVLLEGEVTNGWLFHYNLINGIFFEGFGGQYPWSPISGSFSVHHSIFRTQDSALPVYNLSNASVIIRNNEFDGNLSASLVSDLVNSRFEFSSNRVKGTIGLDFYTSDIPADTGSDFLISNNVFRVDVVGLALEQVFGEGNKCLLQGNNVQNVAGLGIFLGSNTTGCTVIGGSNQTNVLDLGSDNILVGVNNMGTGVGPMILHRLR